MDIASDLDLQARRKVRLPMYRQVAERLRRQILTGEAELGLILPPIQRLAEQFGTSYFTVQTALTALEAEGFVQSRQRVGTVVRYNAAALTCAGLYCGGSLLDDHQFDFYRVILRQLQAQLAGTNVRTEIFLDSRPEEAHAQPLPALAQAAARNEVQALIVPLCDRPCLQWLSKLPVASAFITGDEIPNRAVPDGSLVRLALGRLKARGCRSVGLITTIEKTRARADTSRDNQNFHADFVEGSADLGLRIHNAWVRAPDRYPPNMEREGYEQFHALWEQAEHPDGVLVYPDVAARGAMTAALELGVRVPEELKLVFHRNTDVDWICPLAVDWVESDTAAWAAALIDLVRRQKAGDTVTETRLASRLATSGDVPLSL